VEEIPNGSNLFRLMVDRGDPARLRTRLAERGIELPEPSPAFRGFVITVNETLARKPVAEIVGAFEEAAGA
jgi:hypothetical protein